MASRKWAESIAGLSRGRAARPVSDVACQAACEFKAFGRITWWRDDVLMCSSKASRTPAPVDVGLRTQADVRLTSLRLCTGDRRNVCVFCFVGHVRRDERPTPTLPPACPPAPGPPTNPPTHARTHASLHTVVCTYVSTCLQPTLHAGVQICKHDYRPAGKWQCKQPWGHDYIKVDKQGILLPKARRTNQAGSPTFEIPQLLLGHLPPTLSGTL